MGTIVFDLDGTLADTSGDLLAAANHCFREMGHGDLLLPEADGAIALRGARAMLRAGLERIGAQDEEVVDRYYPVLLEAYEAEIDRHTVLFDGTMEAIGALRQKGHRTAICTNKPERLAIKLIDRLGIAESFDSLIGADTLPVSKPDPAPFVAAVERSGGSTQRATLIGDTVTDRDTARAAGVPSILVTFGPSGPLAPSLHPDHLLEHFDKLPDLIARLGL